MPDLSIENYWVCEDLEYFQTKIKGKAGTYTVTCIRGEWNCDCQAFKFRKGLCKHIKEANKKRCSWHQHHDGGEPVIKNGEKCCPECGGPIRSVRVGV